MSLEALVSICLPVTQGSQYLGEAIESVLSQTHSNLELLILDNASTDSSQAIIEDYASRDRRIKHWRSSVRLPLNAAYNQCFERVTGTFAKPLAQEAVLHPELIRESVHRFYVAPGLVLTASACQHLTAGDSGQVMPPTSPFPSGLAADRHLAGSEIARLSLSPLNNMIGCKSSVLFPSKLIGQGFDPNLTHLGDLEYWLRIILDGSFHRISHELVTVRSTQSSKPIPNTRPQELAREAIYLANKHEWMLRAFELTRDQFFPQSSPYLSSLATP
jgi:glycosyltransferase involved in cell wall biosynthesis